MRKLFRFVATFFLTFLMLAEVPAQAQAGSYDAMPVVRSASEILPPEFLHGPHFRVKDRVQNYGFLDVFDAESDYGPFRAHGHVMLRRLVREIYAISQLKKMSDTAAYTKGLEQSAMKPVEAAEGLVTDPVGTVSGVPEGLQNLEQWAVDRVDTDKSDYEDSTLKSVLTVSSYKRDLAKKLGVDVYSSNKVLQRELNRVGWASAAGNLTPSVALMAVSGPAAIAVSQARNLKSLDDLVTELPPQELDIRNRAALQKIGVNDALIEKFVDDKILSPRHKTIIVQSLVAVDGAKRRDLVLQHAVHARSELDAIFYQQAAEILAGYHRTVSPIVEFLAYPGAVPIARAKNGTLLVAYPVDTLFYTKYLANRADHLAARFGRAQPAQKLEIWLTGPASERTKVAAKKLGIAITEDVDKKIHFMD